VIWVSTRISKNFKDFKSFEATASRVRGIAVLMNP
jgi:hypothetical protein